LENRHNPAAFEPLPQLEEAKSAAPANAAASGVDPVEVEGKAFVFKDSDVGEVSHLRSTATVASATADAPAPADAGTTVTAKLS
ncbi:oxaloacetate decarboxylase, partial [Klebsiella pneumoniae]|nr:oxaloacetate decarboxylase [Klebsiella pneumoniae]